jgi:hypothetical protein
MPTVSDVGTVFYPININKGQGTDRLKFRFSFDGSVEK